MVFPFLMLRVQNLHWIQLTEFWQTVKDNVAQLILCAVYSLLCYHLKGLYSTMPNEPYTWDGGWSRLILLQFVEYAEHVAENEELKWLPFSFSCWHHPNWLPSQIPPCMSFFKHASFWFHLRWPKFDLFNIFLGHFLIPQKPQIST
jgi:hypothetical protein